MKKLASLLLTIIGISLVFSQATISENYIQTREYLEPVTSSSNTAKQIQTVGYFDGLGRPKQTIQVKATPKGNDMVVPIEYDAFGRQAKDYLPISQSGSQQGSIYSNPLSSASAVYGTEKIYSEKILENSPLDRLQQQIPVGNAWQNHPVRYNYDSNQSGEVKKYIASFDYSSFQSTISESGSYGTGQLYKTTVTDEDGNPSIEFKNGSGQVVLVRKVDGTQNLDTYYVYNNYDQLAYVISPKASLGALNETILNELCYQYKYDGRNRLVEKKLPAKGWEYMVYDNQDRLVLTQDENLRLGTSNFGTAGWMFTKYDLFGRVCYSGFFKNKASRVAIQKAISSMNSNNVETRSDAPFSLNGQDIYYTKRAFPTGSMTILSIAYYDTYPKNTPSASTANTLSDNLSSPESTKGLLLCSFVKNIENDDWTTNYIWYDKKGREIETRSNNYLGGSTLVKTELDFAGVVLSQKTEHKRLPTDAAILITEKFGYDHQNRLLRHSHQIGSEAEEVLAENTYDELGRLQSKQLGGSLQKVSYDYNIRGWLSGVNKLPSGGFDANKLFGYQITYGEDLKGVSRPNNEFGQEIRPRYNGNIAEVSWKTLGQEVKRYGYVYDGYNRLLAGLYQNPQNPYSKENSEILSYDENGNITSLKRTANALGNNTTLIDNLNYSYIGNQLRIVEDTSRNPSGYEGGGNRIGYDANGNMTNMRDKGISSISYNYLNLPNRLSLYKSIESGTVSTIYRSDGSKLQKKAENSICGFRGCDTTITTTDYLDGFQYLKKENTGAGDLEMMVERSSLMVAMEEEAFSPEEATGKMHPQAGFNLQFVPTAEGFYDFEKKQYIYQYKDHLGNVKVSFCRNRAGAAEITDANDYYPFGMNHLGTGKSIFEAGSYKNYKYNGKELQETGMYDYGARMYMADLGRWGVVDPLAEETFEPYSYADNNPIFFNDPTGMDSQSFIDTVLEQAVESSAVGKCPPNCKPGLDETKVLLDENMRAGTIHEVIITSNHDTPSVNLPGSLGEPSTVESFIPVWGSARSAINDFQNGNYAWGAFNTAMALSDLIPAKLIGTVVIKAAAKGAGKVFTASIIGAAKQVGEGAAKGVTNGLSKTISAQKQARHIAGTAKLGGGFLNSVDDAQSVLTAVHSGEATFLGTSKAGHQVYRFNGVTGTNVNLGAGITGQPTNVFMIKGTTSPSVVPTNPLWKP